MEAQKTHQPTSFRSVATLQKHACALCAERKVKCDRRVPCSSCIKLRASCEYVAPLPRQRRRRNEDYIVAKLIRYEQLLKSHGIDFDLEGHSGDGIDVNEEVYPTIKSTQPRPPSVEVAPEGTFPKSLWADLSDELRAPKQHLQGEPEDDKLKLYYQTPFDLMPQDGGALLLGLLPVNVNLAALHPEPMQIFRLWQVYIENVDPIVKILHVPTMQQKIFEVAGNLESASKSMHALLLAIYTISIVSMRASECESIMGDTKSTLLTRFRVATQHALIAAEFMDTSDILALQGFVLLLLAAYENNPLWILSGVAIRMGHRIGLHSEIASASLSVFEQEMRRRLWWQIIFLETRATLHPGAELNMTTSTGNIKLPLNVNDSDLYPNMKRLPLEHSRPTEMLYCLLKYSAKEFVLHLPQAKPLEGSWKNLSNASIPVAVRSRVVDELQEYIEQKYTRHCDLKIPLHALSITMARSAISRMRIMLYHPRYSNRKTQISQEENDVVFQSCVEIIECENQIRRSRYIERLLTHLTTLLQFDALIYILSELRHRTTGEQVDRAWKQVEEVYMSHPELIANVENTLFVAIGGLALSAWDARSKDLSLSKGTTNIWNCPAFISELRYTGKVSKDVAKLDISKSRLYPLNQQPETKRSIDPKCGEAPTSKLTQFDIDHLMGIDLATDKYSPMDWHYWEDLMQGDSNNLEGFDIGNPSDY